MNNLTTSVPVEPISPESPLAISLRLAAVEEKTERILQIMESVMGALEQVQNNPMLAAFLSPAPR